MTSTFTSEYFWNEENEENEVLLNNSPESLTLTDLMFLEFERF